MIPMTPEDFKEDEWMGDAEAQGLKLRQSMWMRSRHTTRMQSRTTLRALQITARGWLCQEAHRVAEEQLEGGGFEDGKNVCDRRMGKLGAGTLNSGSSSSAYVNTLHRPRNMPWMPYPLPHEENFLLWNWIIETSRYLRGYESNLLLIPTLRSLGSN